MLKWQHIYVFFYVSTCGMYFTGKGELLLDYLLKRGDLFVIPYIEYHVYFIKLPSKWRKFLLIIYNQICMW